MQKCSRRDVIKMLALTGVASGFTVKVFGNSEEIQKSAEEVSLPVIKGFDNKPHYPVMRNQNGEMSWEEKNAFEIVTDINKGVAEVQKLSRGQFIPSEHKFDIVIPSSKKDCLKKEFPYGVDVEWYIRNCWKNIEVRYLEPMRDGLLEKTGYNGSSEFIVSYFWLSENYTPWRFVYSQYGI